jgi:L-alanine-DL-glutamate epimerase-like enolase superfamily enzyme
VTTIASVSLDVLEVPLRAPLETGAARWTGRRLGLVRITGAGGEQGLGEVALEGHGDAAIAVPGDAAAALVGLDPSDLAALEIRLGRLDGLPGIGRALRSAVETAAADLAARSAGVPLAVAMAGRCRPSIAVNGLIGIVDPDTAASLAARLATEGYACLKLKVGDEGPDALAARLGAVRATVGPGMLLRVDANGAWPDVARAASSLHALAPFGLEYAEQPLPAALGPGALARLRETSDVPIAADESVTGMQAARALLEAGAVDVLVVKPARVGGVRQALRIAALAAGAGVPVVVSTLLETGIGLAAALHVAAALPGATDGERAHGLATGEVLVSDLLAEPLAIAGGRLAVPSGAGLGVVVDAAAVSRYRVAPAAVAIERHLAP